MIEIVPWAIRNGLFHTFACMKSNYNGLLYVGHLVLGNVLKAKNQKKDISKGDENREILAKWSIPIYIQKCI
jgi:hypothetical protein